MQEFVACLSVHVFIRQSTMTIRSLAAILPLLQQRTHESASLPSGNGNNFLGLFIS